ncbi:MAG TPA: Crp/Fnr family transcriptional regulator [Rhizomicrobium sp.]|nr:Crp/Fnr family transcriptional regulator [Rhizomicrobium sp.]
MDPVQSEHHAYQPHPQPGSSILSALVRKLESFEIISEEVKQRIGRLPLRVASFAAREDLVRESEPRGEVRVLIEGMAGRYKALDGGRHAILGFLLPGDVDEADALADELDHGIAAISPCKVAMVSRFTFDQLLVDFPEVGRGFRRMARLDGAIARMWLTNMGQRPADRQAAHLLCELHVRLSAVGMGGPDGFTNPLTQEHLANVLGISSVHMNRVMQHLREEGLIRIEGHVLRFPSSAKIREYAGFDGGYLMGEGRTPAPESQPHAGAPDSRQRAPAYGSETHFPTPGME